MTKLFIGNLPFSATEESVRALFAPHGTIESLALINDRDTGRPRGFGFIEMSNADASKAMTQTSEVIVQLFAGIDDPHGVKLVFPEGAPTVKFDTVYSLGVRVLFDWRRYF